METCCRLVRLEADRIFPQPADRFLAGLFLGGMASTRTWGDAIWNIALPLMSGKNTNERGMG